MKMFDQIKIRKTKVIREFLKVDHQTASHSFIPVKLSKGERMREREDNFG